MVFRYYGLDICRATVALVAKLQDLEPRASLAPKYSKSGLRGGIQWSKGVWQVGRQQFLLTAEVLVE